MTVKGAHGDASPIECQALGVLTEYTDQAYLRSSKIAVPQDNRLLRFSSIFSKMRKITTAQ
jgi:hypothetical protein